MGKKLDDLTGKKFGRWTVISRAFFDKKTFWNVLCDCGNKKTITSVVIKSGESRSCGCIQKTHDYKDHPLYGIVNNQKSRCRNKSHPKYKDYGARGIEFRFDTYKEAIEYYLTLGPAPSPLHTLDRADNNGHYEIGNIKWATKKEQALNQRKKRNTSSKYRGVRIDKDSKKWVAKITKEGVVLFLGRFQNEIDAASAYLEKYFELHKKWPPEYSKTPLCYKTPLHHLGLIT